MRDRIQKYTFVEEKKWESWIISFTNAAMQKWMSCIHLEGGGRLRISYGGKPQNLLWVWDLCQLCSCSNSEKRKRVERLEKGRKESTGVRIWCTPLLIDLHPIRFLSLQIQFGTLSVSSLPPILPYLVQWTWWGQCQCGLFCNSGYTVHSTVHCTSIYTSSTVWTVS